MNSNLIYKVIFIWISNLHLEGFLIIFIQLTELKNELWRNTFEYKMNSCLVSLKVKKISVNMYKFIPYILLNNCDYSARIIIMKIRKEMLKIK
jgi:hypothetical protein